MKMISIYSIIFSIVFTFCFAEEAEASEANYPLLLTQSLKDQYKEQKSIEEQKREKREDLRVFYCYQAPDETWQVSKKETVNFIEVKCPGLTYDRALRPSVAGCHRFLAIVFKKDLSFWQSGRTLGGISGAKDSKFWKPIHGKNENILVLESQKHELDLKTNEYFDASAFRSRGVMRYKCYPMD